MNPIPNGEILFEVSVVRKTSGKPAEVKTDSVRASISFPADLYRTLEGIAKQKKVSIAWVVREAAEQYISATRESKGKRI